MGIAHSGITLAMGGIAGIILINRKFEMKTESTCAEAVSMEIRRGWPVFVSNISVTFYIQYVVPDCWFFSERKITRYV